MFGQARFTAARFAEYQHEAVSGNRKFQKQSPLSLPPFTNGRSISLVFPPGVPWCEELLKYILSPGRNKAKGEWTCNVHKCSFVVTLRLAAQSNLPCRSYISVLPDNLICGRRLHGRDRPGELWAEDLITYAKSAFGLK